MAPFLRNLYSEENVVIPDNIKPSQVVIIGKHSNAFIYGTESFFLHAQKAIIFPDREKAYGFVEKHKSLHGEYDDFREAMIKDDYFFYIVDISKQKEKYYADEIRMTSNYQLN